MAYFGLYALQHRGQESTGIASYDGKHIRLHAGMGLVPDVYDWSSGFAASRSRWPTTAI